jgi:hypothetical protein
MDKIKQYLTKENLIPAGVGLVIGLLIGWFVIGWGLWPVAWVDGEAQHLRADLQSEWLKMTIQSFEKTKDIDQALARWDSLGGGAEAVLNQLRTDPEMDVQVVNTFAELVTAEIPAVPAAGDEPAEEGGGINLRVLFISVCGLGLIIAGALVYFLLLRKRGGKSDKPSAMSESQRMNREADKTDFAADGLDVPIAQFMTTYKLGNNFYDDSFSIDSPAGEFLGECGVGVSETIGVGDPKKVTALEVWLFDKNDIQTVTKVVMSDYGFEDGELRQKLSAKGDPVKAKIGDQVDLETATLLLAARVVDMEYASGALPEKSYFEHVTIELAVWPKE